MMTRSIFRAITAAAVAALAAGCVQTTGSNLLSSPTPATGGGTTSAAFYVGTWQSQTVPNLPSISSCSNLQWTVTGQTASSLAGNFSAVCAGGLSVSGSAAGQLNSDGVTIPMSATGTASQPGIPVNCGFTLNGTGHLQPDNSIVVDYTGNTCLGPVSGTDTLRKAG